MSSSSGSNAVVPFLGPWWAALLRSSSGNTRPGDRALGAAATLGLSIVILRLVAEALKAAKGDEESGSSTLRIIQGLLRGLFASRDSEEKKHDSAEMVLHKGSCHCQAVAFELVAPRTLSATRGPGKISYAQTSIQATKFRFTKGTDHLQMYYVSVAEPKVGAHTFCSRCGVHILYAPSPDSDTLCVNASCVEEAKIKVVRTNKSNGLSSGVPVERQWEEESRNAADDVTSFACSKLDESEHADGAIHFEEPYKNPALATPGTPSTVGTVGTDSVVSTMRWRSLALENDSSMSEGSDAPLSNTLKLLPPLNTSLPRTFESGPATSTTPMMRDQLKYYMSKHLSEQQRSSSLDENVPMNEQQSTNTSM